MAYTRARSFVRDAVIGTAVIAGLYGLAYVEFQPVQIPGYLLIVGFDMLEGVFGPVSIDFELVFGLYLVGLGLVGAGVVQGLRTVAPETVPGWRLGVAGALTVVGVLSLSFALAISFQISYNAPVLITGATGLILLALAGWLAGLLGSGTTSTSG